MSGAAAMDMGKNHGAALAAGLINGVGSAGQLLSPFAVAFVSQKYGWNALFHLFVVVSLIAAVLLILKWNYGTENQEDEIVELQSSNPEKFTELGINSNF
jgi:sugar phosphate permease